MRPLLPYYRPEMKVSQPVGLQSLYLLQRRNAFNPVDALLHLKRHRYFSPVTSDWQPRIFHYMMKLKISTKPHSHSSFLWDFFFVENAQL